MASKQRRFMCALVLVVVTLATTACSRDAKTTPTQNHDVRATTASQPASAGSDAVDGQIATITLVDGQFDFNLIKVQPGVVTLRLSNPSDRPVRLAIRNRDQILAEGGPASGKQRSEITLPVEAGITYEYFTPDRNGSQPVGTVVVGK